MKRRSSDGAALDRLTIRITGAERSRLDAIARERGVTPSEVLRAALASLGAPAVVRPELHDAGPGSAERLPPSALEVGADPVADHPVASLEAPPAPRSALAAALARLAAPRGIP